MSTLPAPEPHTSPLTPVDTPAATAAEREHDAGEAARCHSPSLSRRTMLNASGAALLGGAAALAGIPLPTIQAARPSTSAGSLRLRPNIIIIMTDQERYPRHWPAGWADANLPNRKRIADKGLAFTRAFCNSCMCS